MKILDETCLLKTTKKQTLIEFCWEEGTCTIEPASG